MGIDPERQVNSPTEQSTEEPETLVASFVGGSIICYHHSINPLFIAAGILQEQELGVRIAEANEDSPNGGSVSYISIITTEAGRDFYNRIRTSKEMRILDSILFLNTYGNMDIPYDETDDDIFDYTTRRRLKALAWQATEEFWGSPQRNIKPISSTPSVIKLAQNEQRVWLFAHTRILKPITDAEIHQLVQKITAKYLPT